MACFRIILIISSDIKRKKDNLLEKRLAFLKENLTINPLKIIYILPYNGYAILKDILNTSTFSAAFCVLQLMSFKSPSLPMESNNYPFSKFNLLHQSEKVLEFQLIVELL